MRKPRPKHSLRRFTTIGATIDLLRNKRIAFVDPERWDDRNDAEFMRLFKRETGCESLRALCCTQSPETYHHWRVFTHSADGCLVDFEKKPLLASIAGDDRYRAAEMDYIRLEEIPISDYGIDYLPFLKRAGFRPEKEFRIIYTGPCEESVHFLPIELDWIGCIILNPWLPKTIFDSVKKTFLELSGNKTLSVTSSRLINSQTWIGWGKKIVEKGER